MICIKTNKFFLMKAITLVKVKKMFQSRKFHKFYLLFK